MDAEEECRLSCARDKALACILIGNGSIELKEILKNTDLTFDGECFT